MSPTISADVGTTRFAVGRVEVGRVVSLFEHPTHGHEGPDALLSRLARAIVEAAQGELPQGRLGVACTGLVREGRVTALDRAAMPGWDSFPLAPRLAELLEREVVLLNGGNAAVWGEASHGAARGCQDAVCILIGTGIGAGIVAQGKLLAGRGHAGEVGHAFVDPQAPACGCGRRGCLDAVASGAALARAAREELGLQVELQELIERGAHGDPGPRTLVARSTKAVARAIRDLVAVLDPERFVIGGRVGLAPFYRETLRHALDAEGVKTPVVPSELGSAAGVVGAAEWALGEGEGF